MLMFFPLNFQWLHEFFCTVITEFKLIRAHCIKSRTITCWDSKVSWQRTCWSLTRFEELDLFQTFVTCDLWNFFYDFSFVLIFSHRVKINVAGFTADFPPLSNLSTNFTAIAEIERWFAIHGTCPPAPALRPRKWGCLHIGVLRVQRGMRWGKWA